MNSVQNNRKKVEIYTDGSCLGNPGPGGWAAILRFGDAEKELAGGDPETTNNRMELTGVIRALEALKLPCDVTLYTDSKYVCDGINKGWAEKWRANGWMRTKTEPAKNVELWKRVLELTGVHSVRFVWVKGHAENSFNNRCDALAVEQSRLNGSGL